MKFNIIQKIKLRICLLQVIIYHVIWRGGEYILFACALVEYCRAATSPGEIVVNGMSLSRRDTPYSNAGFVVTVGEEDWKKYESSYPFGGVLFQQELEKSAFELAGKTQSAPAQRVTDFVNKRVSSTRAKNKCQIS